MIFANIKIQIIPLCPILKQLTLLTIFGYLLTFSLPVLAVKEKNNNPSITEVFVNTDSGLISIYGSNFENPEVSLGDLGWLFVISSTSIEIVVELPNSLPDGDYKLTVNQGGGKKQDDYDLTVDSTSSHNHAGTYLPVGTTISCAGTQKVTGLNANGDVICGADNDTTYDAEIAALAGTYLPVGTTISCAGNQKVAGLNANGDVICGADNDTTYDAEIAALAARLEALEALHP